MSVCHSEWLAYFEYLFVWADTFTEASFTAWDRATMKNFVTFFTNEFFFPTGCFRLGAKMYHGRICKDNGIFPVNYHDAVGKAVQDVIVIWRHNPSLCSLFLVPYVLFF